MTLPKPLTTFLGLMLNVVSVGCAVLVIWNIAHQRDIPAPVHPATVTVGSKFVLPAGSHTKTPRVVVLGVSTSCGFCRASAGFYEQLAAVRSPAFEIAVLLPEPLSTAAPALPALGLSSVSNVQTADFRTLGINATPTLLVLREDGTVEAAWTGRLSHAQEAEVCARLGIKPFAEPPSASQNTHESEWLLDPQAAARMLARKDIVFVDVRDRASFEAAHILGGLNIPMDELFARVPHELPKDAEIVAYCGPANSSCVARGEDEPGVPSMCQGARGILQRSGLQRVHYISARLSSLAQAGVAGITNKACQ